jgi:hypothetical protein
VLVWRSGVADLVKRNVTGRSLKCVQESGAIQGPRKTVTSRRRSDGQRCRQDNLFERSVTVALQGAVAQRVGHDTCIRKSNTKAAINKNSATARIQEHAEVPLLAEVHNVAGDAQEVLGVVLKADAANCGAPVEYCLILSAGSVSKSNNVLEAPLELVAKCVYLVLDLQRLLDKKSVLLEEQVEALEDSLEAALEDNYAFGTREVDEVRDCTASWEGKCNALDERAWRERVADTSGKLASLQRGQRLFNAREEGAASDGVWGVEDCSCRIDVNVVIVEVVVRVVWDKVASSVVQTLLAAASLGAAVLTISLLSKQLLGACWARH